ncbi:histidine kinase dimerization/phosphoacceptor domain -containing protein [uncultured Polaribacter sp.]|uniref:tetratricopeptide repeat-containing sensor histidine kinase n=1 Tax=uncultured Polaribacter sp. TaxID=174711 RepID=UPI00262D7418|nr:histidine kinase dimerization/phosphoacceptor domain -containing protein [uncultured Polaribacter sp.]
MKILNFVIKFYVGIFFFILISNNTFSQTSIFKPNKETLNKKISKLDRIISLKEKHYFFIDSIHFENKKLISNKKWTAYFENLKYSNENNDEIFYIDFILVGYYLSANRIEDALKLGLKSYKKNEQIINKDDLCHLLILLENGYLTSGNSVGLILINKEKLKNCNPDQILFYNIYFKMGLYDLALKNYKKNSLFGTKEFDKKNIFEKAKIYNNFGVYHMYDEKIDSALYYYKTSLQLIKKQKAIDSTFLSDHVSFWHGLVSGNIGSCYVKKGKYNEAIPLFYEELKESEILYNEKKFTGVEKVWNDLATSYLETNQKEKANIYINKLKDYKQYYYKLKSKFYLYYNNKDSLFYFTDKYVKFSDSIYTNKSKQEKIDLISFLSLEDDLISSKIKISDLEEQESFNSVKIKVVSFLSVFILITFFLLLYYYLEKNKNQKLILKQKTELETSLNKNKILLKELNHRVKNNLQMVSSVLSLQANKISDTNSSKKYFTYSINRIKVLSKIHNSLYTNKGNNEIDLLNYITTLKDYLVSSLINPEINVNFDIDVTKGIYITVDKKITLGLIINELITNTFKYAFDKNDTNLITISIIQQNNLFYFNYKDNGKGFLIKNFDYSKSIGMNLILRLVNQLGDDAIIDSEKGMDISFKFKN